MAENHHHDASRRMDNRSVTGVILAGGKNSRMGGDDKAFLPVEGTPIIERVLAVLVPLFSHTLIVTNSPSRYSHLSHPLVSDTFRDCGPLGGLHAALQSIETESAFVVACDMPYLSRDLIQWLLEQRGAEDVTVPIRGQRPEPLHAIYSQRCLRPLEECLKGDRLAIRDFYQTVNVRYIREEDFSFLENASRAFHNMNTPGEFAARSAPLRGRASSITHER